MLKKYAITALAYILIIGTVQAVPITKGALDLGSSSFKLLVCEVEGQRVDVKHMARVDVALGKHLEANPHRMLNDDIQKVALEAIQELVRIGRKHGVTEFSGISTAALRNAENRDAVLKNLSEAAGVKLRIIDQQKEGELGFNTLVTLMPESDPETFLSCDFGGASFQLATYHENECYVYHGPIGYSQVITIFCEEVKGVKSNRDIQAPLNIEEIDLLIEKMEDKYGLPPQWFMDKIQDNGTQIFWLDDPQWPGVLKSIVNTNENKLTMDQLYQVMTILCDPNHPVFLNTPAERRILRPIHAAFIYSIMKKFNIPYLNIKEFNSGNTLGMMNDPNFWE